MPSPASPIEYHRRMLARNCFFGGKWPQGWDRLPAGSHECSGPLTRMHFVPQQLLRREYPHGYILLADGAIQKRGREDPVPLPKGCELVSLRRLQEDGRLWRYGCGRHHGMLDFSRTIKVPRADLPESVEEFAAQLGLSWWLDREYGERDG